MTSETEYRVVDSRNGNLWWRGTAPSAAAALQSALTHLNTFGKRGLTLTVLRPGQRWDPKTPTRKHT